MSSSNNRNSLSQLYEKSLRKVSGVYVQTKQNSIKFLSTLNINIANKTSNEQTEVEQKTNYNFENYDKETKYVDSKPAFFNPLTPYQIESYHNFITDKEDDNVNSAYSMGSPLYKNTPQFPLCSPRSTTYLRKSPHSEKDFSDQESLDDQDGYFSRKMSNYSSPSSSSSVSSNYGYNELALTPLSNDKNDEGYEIINEEEIVHIEQEKEKPKGNILKRRKSNMKSNQKSERNIKLRSKLSLKLSKNKSSSTATDKIGTINFEEFISSLNISEDIEDRLQWLFRFYDNDGDGFITRDEMIQIMHTLYN